MSNSMDTSCPRRVSSIYRRCARLLKLWVRNRIFMAMLSYSNSKLEVRFRRAGYARRTKLSGKARPTDSCHLEIEMELANPRQLLACQPVNNAPPAERGLHLDETVQVFGHLAHHGGIASQRMRAHRLQQALGILRRADRREFAFVGDVERIKP